MNPFSKMVNHAVPGTIDPKHINTKKPLNVFQIKVRKVVFLIFLILFERKTLAKL